MLPFYPLNQHPAGDNDGCNLRPASRLEIQQKFLEHERHQHLAMLSASGGPEHRAANPVMVAAWALHQGIAWLVSLAGNNHAPRVTTSPSQGMTKVDHPCIPGVDC